MKKPLEYKDLVRVHDGQKTPCTGCNRLRNYMYQADVSVRVGRWGKAQYSAGSLFCHVCVGDYRVFPANDPVDELPDRSEK